MFLNLVILVLLGNFGSIITESDIKFGTDVFHQNVSCTDDNDCAGRWNWCTLKIGDQKFCQCLEGSSGENCTVVDQCRDGLVECGTNNNASCMLGQKGKAYCVCDEYLGSRKRRGFDEQTKTCRDCNCGDVKSVGTTPCIFDVTGMKKCNCYSDSYQNEEGVCVDCGCGFASVGCKIKNGVKICECFPGFASNGTSCIDCECGSHATCTMSDGETVCSCDPGYLLSGPNGHCRLECDASNPCEHGGTCSEGACICLNGTGGDLCRIVHDCGYGSMCGEADCLYDVHAGKAYCKCMKPNQIFDDYSKECLRCDCGKGGNCSIIENSNGTKVKQCVCAEGFSEDSGTCRECDCQLEGSNCTFVKGLRKCRCPQGFSGARHSFTEPPVCKDVDECLDSGSCPKSATCVNTVGSYECVCGSEKVTATRDVKSEGCPAGGLDSWEIAGIVAGCIFGTIIIIAGINKYRTYRWKTMELQSNNPLYSVTYERN